MTSVTILSTCMTRGDSLNYILNLLDTNGLIITLSSERT